MSGVRRTGATGEPAAPVPAPATVPVPGPAPGAAPVPGPGSGCASAPVPGAAPVPGPGPFPGPAVPVVPAAPAAAGDTGDGVEAAAGRLAVAVGRMVRQMRRVGTADVGPGSLAALATLHRCGPMRLGDLAGREGVAPPTLSRIVAALEEAGYVARETDPRDRRAVRVAITPVGAAVVQGIGTARTRHLTARLRALPPESLRALVDALPALERLAEEDG